jgi:hypothetical protein
MKIVFTAVCDHVYEDGYGCSVDARVERILKFRWGNSIENFREIAIKELEGKGWVFKKDKAQCPNFHGKNHGDEYEDERGS